VIGRFGFIAKNEPNGSAELMQAGRDLNRVYADRVGSDYDIENITTTDQAEECLNKAKNFLIVCARHFGFEYDYSERILSTKPL
jgi:hypothetical protein